MVFFSVQVLHERGFFLKGEFAFVDRRLASGAFFREPSALLIKRKALKAFLAIDGRNGAFPVFHAQETSGAVIEAT
jgi:hypothetical protein